MSAPNVRKNKDTLFEVFKRENRGLTGFHFIKRKLYELAQALLDYKKNRAEGMIVIVPWSGDPILSLKNAFNWFKNQLTAKKVAVPMSFHTSKLGFRPCCAKKGKRRIDICEIEFVDSDTLWDRGVKTAFSAQNATRIFPGIEVLYFLAENPECLDQLGLDAILIPGLEVGSDFMPMILWHEGKLHIELYWPAARIPGRAWVAVFA